MLPADSPLLAHLLYALAWASFGAGHSLLAHGAVHEALARVCGGAVRLVYNALALAHLAAVLWVGERLLAGQADFAWAASFYWPRMAVLAIAAGFFAAALGSYDLSRFLGSYQLRAGRFHQNAPGPEPLVISTLHHYVRHPLYSALMLAFWAWVHDPLSVATATWASLYVIVGSRFEEGALIRQHGRRYKGYVERVPAFVPWRGRAL